MNGELSLFYLLHTKITMNIIEMAVRLTRVQINGVRINEGPLYDETSGPSLRHIQPDCRQTVTLANTEYTPAGLNPMLRVLFQAEGIQC